MVHHRGLVENVEEYPCQCEFLKLPKKEPPKRPSNHIRNWAGILIFHFSSFIGHSHKKRKDLWLCVSYGYVWDYI